MGHPEESALLKRCLQGDPEAWDELFDRHYAAAGRFVCQLGHNFAREDVEEICQETFLSVVKNLRDFQGHCQFQTWVFRIAANKARDYRERQRAVKRGGAAVTLSINQEDPDDARTIDPPSPLLGPDQTLLRKEDIAFVDELLDQLGGPCQEIIELRYFGDLSYDEIANTLDLNPKTVSSRLSKCLDKLEALFKKRVRREKNTPTSV